jgi:dienelactone hydrolase
VSPVRAVVSGVLLLMLAAASGLAADVKKTPVSYTAPTTDFTIKGTLGVPAAMAPVPAVVVLHGSGGVDGRGEYHAEALHRQGMATLEIDMWTPRGFKGGPQSRPKRLRETYPDAFGALLFLAQQPEIDPQRIGIMGFAWGGGLALATASTNLLQEFTGGKARFAAHAPFYPACWSFLRTAADFRMSGAPVRIFVGDRDDYDAPDACQHLVDRLPAASKSVVTLTVYPDAYHGWDSRTGSANFFDPNAAQGKGGRVRFFPDGKLAERSRREVVEFFATAFAVTPPTKP